MPSPVGLSEITNEQLEGAMLALSLACGKSHQSLTHKRQQWFCFLFRTLKVEADLRGLPAPAAPFQASHLGPGPETA